MSNSVRLGASPRFAGKVAVVTGAGCVGEGWGNGRAVAIALAQEGAQVFALDRDANRLEQTLATARALDGEQATAYEPGQGRPSGASQRIVPYLCDVTSSAQLQAMVAQCLKRFGRIDVLVNNVGGSAAGGPVQMDEAVWDSQVDTNLKSVFLTCKHVLPTMVAQGSGSIVNIASTSGLRFTGSAQVAYAATKAGVIQLSRVVAVQHAPNGIRVNTVVPGQLHTPMVETRLAKQRTGGDVAALLEQRQKRIPLGFMGDGRDTAAAVLFLASDEARFITGTELVVDGGMVARCD